MTTCTSRLGTKEEKTYHIGADYGKRRTVRVELFTAHRCEGYCGDCLAMTSRSSISNTNVAPGLIKGGRPLSR
jgi:hypothetical protein